MYISRLDIFLKREILFGLLIDFQKIVPVYLPYSK